MDVGVSFEVGGSPVPFLLRFGPSGYRKPATADHLGSGARGATIVQERGHPGGRLVAADVIPSRAAQTADIDGPAVACRRWPQHAVQISRGAATWKMLAGTLLKGTF